MNGVAGRPSSSVKLLHDEVVYWSWYRHTFILFFENNTFFNMKLSPFPILYLQGCLAYSLSASSMQDFIIIIWVLKTWNSLNVGSAGNVYGRYVNESEFEPFALGLSFRLRAFSNTHLAIYQSQVDNLLSNTCMCVLTVTIEGQSLHQA